MLNFEGDNYFDDRMFVLSVCRGQVTHGGDGTVSTTILHESDAKDLTWCVATYRNCKGYPAAGILHFESKIDALKYVSLVERTVPLISLDGQAPNVTLSYAEFLKWKTSNKMADYDYKKAFLPIGTNPSESFLQTSQQFKQDQERVRQTLKGGDHQKISSQSLRQYEQEAEAGDVETQLALGSMYGRGADGLPRDFVQCLKWYSMAAERGNSVAQNGVGIRYAKGEGVVRNMVKAYMWFSLSAIQGNTEALSNIKNAAKEMSPEEIASAKQLAKEWRIRS